MSEFEEGGEVVIEYEDLQRIGRQNLGTIIRISGCGEERMWLSPHRHPDRHPTVLEVALWTCEDANFSEYQTYMRRSLESGVGRSIVNDGTYADDYLDAINWIREKSSTFTDEPIEWLDYPKMIVAENSMEDIDE